MRILVLLGGASAEREVSLASGARVAEALRAKGHDVTTADPGDDPLAILPEARAAEVVWMALHGGAGEDGTIQALFDLAGVRYTGSGHLASALAMDKDLSKHLFRARASRRRTGGWSAPGTARTGPSPRSPRR